MAKTQTATKQEVISVRPIDRFKHQLKLAAPLIRHMVPDHISFEKAEATIVVAVSNNEKLLQCTPQSLLRAAVESLELGLSLNPSLKEADILPVWNKKLNNGQGGLEAQMRPRVKGYMKLATQGGEVKKIECHIRYSKDRWKRSLGTNPHIEHEPADGDRGEKRGVYCIWWFKNGEWQNEYMDEEQVLEIRDRSPSKNQKGELVGPWVTDEDEMWRKTVIRRASKYMPLTTTSFQRAVALDDAREGGMDFVLNSDSDDEIIDVTAEPETHEVSPQQAQEQQTPAEKQLDSLAKKVTSPPIDWGVWAMDRIKDLESMKPEQRREWSMKHAQDLSQIQMKNPAAAKKILEMVK